LKSLIPKVGKGKPVANKIKYAIYLDEMIKFHDMPKVIRDSERAAKDLKLENEMERFEWILKTFTEPAYNLGEKIKYIKTSTMILKNIFFILVLSLVINQFEFDYRSLARSLKMELKQLTQYFREIGCGFKSVKDKKGGNPQSIVVFKAPMKFSETKKPSQAKNKK
jgi:hypothetical protein